MSPLTHHVPLNAPVRIRDRRIVGEIVALINDRITGRSAEDEGTEIYVLSGFDQDAPAGLSAPTPGLRHFQIDLLAEGARVRCIVGVLGRAGSELIGYTPDELREAANNLGTLTSELLRGGKVTPRAASALREYEQMLGAPADDPRRWQPIASADLVIVHAIAEASE
jgi:hypothetical protein